MKSGTRYLIFFFVVVVQFGQNECWRSSRPSSPSRRPTPSPHRPFPTHAPTYRPFPTYRPAPTRAPTYRPFPTHAPTYRPFPTHAPTHRPFPTHAPTYRPVPTHAPTYRPVPTHAPTYRPVPTQYPTYRPVPTHYPTYRPVPTHAPTYPNYRPSPTRAPTRYTTRYPTQRIPTGPRPTYPGYTNGGISPPKVYQPSYSVPIRVPSAGGTKVKVYNIHNYHPANYYAPPSYPIYHYTHRDTGSSALGFYLGYSLGRISHPTYYHQDYRFYDGYSPRYDHYTVHHYYHGSSNVPKQQTVTTNVIIRCGDGSMICPANTTSLCTADGQIMCVVIASNTIPCADNPSLRCVKSSIPCENNEAPECKGIPKGQLTTVNIPCISNTTIQGNISTVNNTIVSNDPKPNVTANQALVKDLPITTTPTNLGTTIRSVPDLGSKRRKRDVAPPPQYCVTVVAEPSKRAPTEGEQVFKEISNVFDKFFIKAFGMDKPQIKKPMNVTNDNYIPKFGD